MFFFFFLPIECIFSNHTNTHTFLCVNSYDLVNIQVYDEFIFESHLIGRCDFYLLEALCNRFLLFSL